MYISNSDCRVSDTGSSCVKCPRGQAPSNDRLKCGGKLIIDNDATNLADIGNYFWSSSLQRDAYCEQCITIAVFAFSLGGSPTFGSVDTDWKLLLKKVLFSANQWQSRKVGTLVFMQQAREEDEEEEMHPTKLRRSRLQWKPHTNRKLLR